MIPLLLMVINITSERHKEQTRAEAYADDFSTAGKIDGIRCWWDNLLRIGPLFGYHPEAKKCWLIVKPGYLEKAEKLFSDTKTKITTEGQRHLSSALGSNSFRDEYVSKKIEILCAELTVLSEIALIEPHCAYACFVSGFKNKLTFMMRTIPIISQHHILESLIDAPPPLIFFEKNSDPLLLSAPPSFTLREEIFAGKNFRISQNIWLVRKYFMETYGIDPPIINWDQMPLHRNESASQKTLRYLLLQGMT